MNSDTYLSTGAALLGAALSWFIGDIGGLLQLLIALVIIDQITGLLKSRMLGRWASGIGFNGIARKVVMFMFIGIANLVQHELPGHSDALRDAVICFYITNEGLSIIENAIDMNAPIPDALKEWFLSWHNKHLTSKNSPQPDEYD